MTKTRPLTLRGLQAALAVHRERHFGRAAERLGISQPSLSQLVGGVEDAIGARLFERRPVRPTRGGREFLDRVAASLGTLDEAVTLARATFDGQRGTLRVGFAASAVLSPMPAVLAAFRRATPQVDIVLSERSTAEQLDLVAGDELDVGFVRQFGPRADLTRVRISREPFVAALPADHPLARRDHVPLGALADESFVHFPRALAPNVYDELEQMCAAARFTPRVVQTASHWMTIIALVEARMGVSLVPASLERLAWPRVRFLPIRPAGPPAEVFAIFRRAPTKIVARFRDVMRKTLTAVSRTWRED